MIVCEGQKTERYYFEGLKRTLGLQTMEIQVEPLGAAPITVVDYALELREERKKRARRSPILTPYDDVWCVVDVEIPPHESLNRACVKARDNNLKFALSNPCFEYWYLIHFEHTSALMNSIDEVITRLKHHQSGYKKNDPDFFTIVFPHTQKAIDNAEAVLREKHYEDDLRKCNPSTHVHRIVKKLLEIKENS
ncbi:MAG: RloB domain-containing protein [Sedimentisphaerales bacterium]|nr:RloB domain-containing protein [Sedimentisphaerales bacterium]